MMNLKDLISGNYQKFLTELLKFLAIALPKNYKEDVLIEIECDDYVTKELYRYIKIGTDYTIRLAKHPKDDYAESEYELFILPEDSGTKPLIINFDTLYELAQVLDSVIASTHSLRKRKSTEIIDALVRSITELRNTKIEAKYTQTENLAGLFYLGGIALYKSYYVSIPSSELGTFQDPKLLKELLEVVVKSDRQIRNYCYEMQEKAYEDKLYG